MEKVERLIEDLIGDLLYENGRPAIDRYTRGRDLDVKMAEFRILLSSLTDNGQYLIQKFDLDKNREGDSVEIRLQTLLAYSKTALKLLKEGVLRPRGAIISSPDFSKLAGEMPGLVELLQKRWKEIQGCMNVGAYWSALVLMGSTLEGLVMARCNLDSQKVQRTSRAPKQDDGQVKSLADWRFTELIVAAIELGWLTASPKDFKAGLRKYETLIHPFSQAAARIEINQDSAHNAWKTLNKAIEDLLASV